MLRLWSCQLGALHRRRARTVVDRRPGRTAMHRGRPTAEEGYAHERRPKGRMQPGVSGAAGRGEVVIGAHVAKTDGSACRSS